jgi:hypothetical protein
MPMAPEPFGPVVIGAREIYDAVVRVSAKVDLLSMQMTAQGSDLADQEARIRTLERARWPLPSMAVLTSIAALIAAVLIH